MKLRHLLAVAAVSLTVDCASEPVTQTDAPRVEPIATVLEAEVHLATVAQARPVLDRMEAALTPAPTGN